MPTYAAEKHRRIAQFTRFLRLMRRRTQKIVKGDCFATFDDMPPDDADAGQLKESVAITADCLANGGSAVVGSDSERPGSNPEELPRYIQFAFRRDCFYLDLSNNTLAPSEAEQIFRCRDRFFYARDRIDLKWVRANWDDIVKWNPLQKVYLYRDEESAAEDMAFIMFQVWNFPVDSPWYIKARSFHTWHEFEWGKRLD